MAIDGNYDGKIIIQKGQGISQAIRDELGLTQAECNKLGGSIWAKIFEQVEAQNQQGKIYSGGSDLNGAASKNFVVHPNQVIEFSKDIWNNIVQLVNDKLGKNIEKLNSNQPAGSNPPVTDPNPPVIDTNPPVAYQKLPQHEQRKDLAGQTLKQKDGTPLIEFDTNGNVKNVYDPNGNKIHHIRRNSDGSVNSYTDYEYDENGNKIRSIIRNPDGSVNSYTEYEYDENGNKICSIIRNPDGSVDSYTEYEYDENGNEIRYIRRNPDGSVDSYSEREYDADGHLIKETWYNPDGTPFEYD